MRLRGGRQQRVYDRQDFGRIQPSPNLSDFAIDWQDTVAE